MWKRITAIISALFIAFLVTLTALKIRSLYLQYLPVSYQATPGQETDVILENPFRGFLNMRGFSLSEADPDEVVRLTRRYIDAGTYPLMLIEINLKNYAGADLSENALRQLDSILSELSDAKRQVILRFLYDWDGQAMETEPENVEQILAHMEQVAPVVNRYEAAVFIVQGTFAGNWGEMHHSKFSSHEYNRLLMTHLAGVISPPIFLAARTPSQLRGITLTREIIAPEDAFGGSLGARLGLFNDGMLGSESDLGTYDDSPNTDTVEPEDKGTREEEIAFQSALCQFVPNGGEAVLDNPCNDLENALRDLAAMHISYLSSEHDTAVLNKWKDSIYHGEDCFDGMSGFAYIDAHLGYRYVLTDSAMTHDPFEPSSTELSFAIQNTGFAPSYRRFDGMLTLTQTGDGTQYSFPADIDNRMIGGGSERAFSLPLPLDGLPDGGYQVSFSLTDPYTGQTIGFASDNSLSDGCVQLGKLTIESKTPEDFFSDLFDWVLYRLESLSRSRSVD